MRGVPDPDPSSDGLVWQRAMWIEAPLRLRHEALDRHPRGREDLIVDSELVLDYEPAPIGGRRNSVISELMLVFGVSAHGRSSCKICEEGVGVPQLVPEVALASTVDSECGSKVSLGVRQIVGARIGVADSPSQNQSKEGHGP